MKTENIEVYITENVLTNTPLPEMRTIITQLPPYQNIVHICFGQSEAL
jgi:hypothetical protein